MSPLLVAFHGNTRSIAQEIDTYRPINATGWMVAMPQSAQPWGMEGDFVWGDWETTTRQVERDWKLIQAQYQFDVAQVDTGGLSKGAEVALWAAMSGTIPACGAILLAPGGPLINDPARLLPFINVQAERNLRFYLIVGDADSVCFEPTKSLAQFFDTQGIPHILEIIPDVGHGFPPDFESYLKRALQFITE